MIHLEHPSNEMWELRRDGFEQKAEPPEGGGYLLREQACAMVADLQCAFCAGAWIAVVVLAAAAIDAQLHDAEGFTGNAKRVIDEAGADPQLHALRKRCNALIHSDPDSPAITVDQQWSERVNPRRGCPACGRTGLSRVLCQRFSLSVGKICNVKSAC